MVLKKTPPEDALAHHIQPSPKEELPKAPSWATWLGGASFLGNLLEEGRGPIDFAQNVLSSTSPGNSGSSPETKPHHFKATCHSL